jgi:hypothetical protein
VATVATAAALLRLAFYLAYRKRLRAGAFPLRVANEDVPDIEDHPQMPQAYSD